MHTELDRLSSSRLCGGGFSAKVNVCERSSSVSAAQGRTVAPECEAADIIAQRPGRSETSRQTSCDE
eukprot:2091304-Prymnesium_polylepis.1